ncbi:unnamed protein product [Rodentolepis nana]|uniref:ENTH domain-containing protein n=1 Tax=Rodentolepis nana TaxID=102285 RepID=A0A158QHS7_RODNA|nr:unnamed protein product [Rodentolepis nana]
MPLRRKIKNSVGRYSQAELLVREATSNDPTIPSQQLLLQIAEMTKLPHNTDTINMVFKRLNDKCKNWRHIYKALVVIEACLQYGSIAFIKECRSQLPQILTLCDFVYSYDRNSNAGFLIREKAQRVATLLKDENLLKQERQAAKSERLNRHSTYARSPIYSDASEIYDQVEKSGRSRSVYNPSDEYVSPNRAEEWEQMRLAKPSEVQESQKLDASNKSTLLERSRTAVNVRLRNLSLMKMSTRSEDLLLFDDPPPKTGRFNAWLESRSKRLSNMSTSDIYTPSSSLIGKYSLTFDSLTLISSFIYVQTDSGSNANEKWSTGTFGIKGNILEDLSGLDFGKFKNFAYLPHANFKQTNDKK